MSKIESFGFYKNSIDVMDRYTYGKNWPVVYILEGGNEAYVGETINVARRTKNHLEDPKRKNMEIINIIIDDYFNKSVTLDFESKLIEYISADGKFVLQNANRGLKDHNYYQKDMYVGKFEELWLELINKNIAKNSLFDIRNSDLFKLSPFKALTNDQIDIVNAIENIVSNNLTSKNIIHGEPGSGKTILAVYLAKYFISNDKIPIRNIGVVIPMTSLRGSIRKVFKNIKDLKVSMVMGPTEVVKTKEKFDLLIVDEAHRLAQRKNLSSYNYFDKINKKLGLDKNKGTQLDWILNSSKHVILFYDRNQSVKPTDICRTQFDQIDANRFNLESQMRVKAGKDYPKYIERILRNQVITKMIFEQYDFKLFDNVMEMVNEIIRKDEEFGLSRVVAGYAWDWISKKDKSKYDIKINDYKFRWNSTNSDWINSSNAINEIGCIHTVQGYDMNFTGVIIGPELIMRNGKIIFKRENYKDRYGKHNSISEDDMVDYIINIYKTLLTRGILGTYIYVCDEQLRQHFMKYIDRFNENKNNENDECDL